MSVFEIISVAVLTLAAGFIDSIAGGGGLVALPTVSFVVGAGAIAIGTNKVIGVTAAGVAFLVYIRKHKVSWRMMLAFAFWVGIGSYVGSRVAPLMPKEAFKWFLLASCPGILWLVYHKHLWTQGHPEPHWAHKTLWRVLGIILSGLACGFYDGLWGPGGGTFMLLACRFVIGMPLLAAIATSKFVNFVSAGAALYGYAQSGLVVWKLGLWLALAVTVGAATGARLASANAEKVVRPALAVVSVLLLVKVLFQS